MPAAHNVKWLHEPVTRVTTHTLSKHRRQCSLQGEVRSEDHLFVISMKYFIWPDLDSPLRPTLSTFPRLSYQRFSEESNLNNSTHLCSWTQKGSGPGAVTSGTAPHITDLSAAAALTPNAVTASRSLWQPMTVRQLQPGNHLCQRTFCFRDHGSAAWGKRGRRPPLTPVTAPPLRVRGEENSFLLSLLPLPREAEVSNSPPLCHPGCYWWSAPCPPRCWSVCPAKSTVGSKYSVRPPLGLSVRWK